MEPKVNSIARPLTSVLSVLMTNFLPATTHIVRFRSHRLPALQTTPSQLRKARPRRLTACPPVASGRYGELSWQTFSCRAEGSAYRLVQEHPLRGGCQVIMSSHTASGKLCRLALTMLYIV